MLYCLRALNGSLVWQHRTNDWVVASPVRFGNLIVFASLNSYVYAVWVDTGAVRAWTSLSLTLSPSLPLSLSPSLPLSLSPSLPLSLSLCLTCFVSARISLLVSFSVCIVTWPPQLAWRYRTLGSVWASPAVSGDGKVYVGSSDRFMYCLEGSTGRLLWSRSMGAEVGG